MNVVKEQGRNRGKTQHYMLTADPTLLRSCWEVEREETEDGTEAVKTEDRRGDAAQKVERGPGETPNKKRLFEKYEIWAPATCRSGEKERDKIRWSRKKMFWGKIGGWRSGGSGGVQRGVWRNAREAESGVSSGRLPAALPTLWSYLACLLGVHEPGHFHTPPPPLAPHLPHTPPPVQAKLLTQQRSQVKLKFCYQCWPRLRKNIWTCAHTQNILGRKDKHLSTCAPFILVCHADWGEKRWEIKATRKAWSLKVQTQLRQNKISQCALPNTGFAICLIWLKSATSESIRLPALGKMPIKHLLVKKRSSLLAVLMLSRHRLRASKQKLLWSRFLWMSDVRRKMVI